MQMHNEDLFAKMDQIYTKIKVTKNKVSKCVEQNELTLEKLDDFQRDLNKNSQWCQEIDDATVELYKKKLDIRKYEAEISEVNASMLQLQKRVTLDESEFQSFGEFVCRYIPIMT